MLDPEIVWDGARMGMPDLAGIFHGHEGVREFWRRWLSAWENLEFEFEDVLDAGDDVVALIGNQTARGRGSGVEVRMGEYAIVFTFRQGKVVRWCAYPAWDEALRAAGIEDR